MEKNNKYVAPSLSVMNLASSDVITTSPGGGYDSEDNWLADVFPVK